MRLGHGLALITALLSGCAGAQRTTRSGNGPQAFLISIDGLRPEMYLSKDFAAPTLKSLAEKGAWAEGVRPVYPSVTYPNHTSIVTGVRAATHGIHSNLVFSEQEGPTSKWYWNASQIRAMTLWDAARDAGLTSALVSWPVTVGARSDWVLPEIFPENSFEMSAMWELTRKATPTPLWQEVAESSGGLYADTLERDRWFSNAAATVVRNHSPDLLLLHYGHVDRMQHVHGRDAAQTRESVAQIDAELGKLLLRADPARTCVFITGDHGFSDVSSLVHVNTIFAKNGWLQEEGGKIVRWKAYAHLNGAQAAVYLKDKSIEPQALEALKAGAPGHYRILTRADLDSLGAFPGASFALEPLAGFAIGRKTAGPLIEKLGRAHGEHGLVPGNPEMHSGFIASGPCASRGKRLGRIDLVDVAPTVAEWLGIALQQTEGKALPIR